MLKCLWCQSLKRQATFPLSCCWLLSESLVSGKLINPLNQRNFLRPLTIVFVLAAVRCPTAPTDCSRVRTDLWGCWSEVHTWEIQWRFFMLHFTLSTYNKYTHRSLQHCSKCLSIYNFLKLLGIEATFKCKFLIFSSYLLFWGSFPNI